MRGEAGHSVPIPPGFQPIPALPRKKRHADTNRRSQRRRITMGYHVTILRTRAGQVQHIGRNEVNQAVASMPGRLSVMPGRPERWLYQPVLGEESGIIDYDALDGVLWANLPSDDLLALMIELAGKLAARVRGDEGETYRTVDATYAHPDDAPLHHPPVRAGETSRKLSPVARITVVLIAVAIVVVAVGLYRDLAM